MESPTAPPEKFFPDRIHEVASPKAVCTARPKTRWARVALVVSLTLFPAIGLQRRIAAAIDDDLAAFILVMTFGITLVGMIGPVFSGSSRNGR